MIKPNVALSIVVILGFVGFYITVFPFFLLTYLSQKDKVITINSSQVLVWKEGKVLENITPQEINTIQVKGLGRNIVISYQLNKSLPKVLVFFNPPNELLLELKKLKEPIYV
ncbi:MAG: hypothetical protein ACLGGX_12640 [Bdellovibrionia bacterium]